VRDGLVDHWRESYVCETGKSMKAMELAVAQEDCCCNIPIALMTPDKARRRLPRKDAACRLSCRGVRRGEPRLYRRSLLTRWPWPPAISPRNKRRT
jgi:hypothetical protein